MLLDDVTDKLKLGLVAELPEGDTEADEDSGGEADAL